MMADDDSVAKELIARLRIEIDNIDEKIIDLVRLRTEISARIARLKRYNNLPMITGKREMDVFSRYAAALGQLGRTMASALLLRSKQLPEPDFKVEDKANTPQ